MTTNARTSWLSLTLLGALVTFAAGAQAQQVSVSGSRVEVFDTDGDSAVVLDNGADYTAGGNGRTATLNLRGTDGPTTFWRASSMTRPVTSQPPWR